MDTMKNLTQSRKGAKERQTDRLRQACCATGRRQTSRRPEPPECGPSTITMPERATGERACRRTGEWENGFSRGGGR